MDKITIEVEDLIKVIQENQKAHRRIFEKALIGYRKEILAALERRIENVKRGEKVDHYIRLPEPEDHTADYDRVIKMLQMSCETQLAISEADFAMYVMDEWNWKGKFTETTSKYS